MKLSDKLIDLRKAKGWSQEDFAEKMDVSRQAISRWENGTALPDAQNILRISKLFGVTADYLLNDDYENEINDPVTGDATDAPTAEEMVSLTPTKRRLWWYLIPAACFLILAVCVIIKAPKDELPVVEEVHIHSALSSFKEAEIAPTCTAEGSYDEVIYCTECGEEILRTSKSVAKLSHTLAKSVKENEVAPTCAAAGSYEEVVYCTKCNNAVLKTRRSIDQLSHEFEDKKCTLCGEDQPSDGLLYISGGDGTCIVARGDCTDENVVIPAYSPSGDRVTKITDYAFWGFGIMKSIKIPETVTYIGTRAFEDCTSLESVNLPSKIKVIYAYTFEGCQSLKEITIPYGVLTIGEGAFADCVACEEIFIPASVTKIGAFAFRNFSSCDGTITLAVSNGWKLYDASGVYYNSDVDFLTGIFTPTMALTFAYTEYMWRRG